MIFSLISCSFRNDKSPETWSDLKLNEWFSNVEWHHDWEFIPDETIDIKTFASYYFQNPNLWDKAFKFLKENKLADLKVGKYVLEGSDLFVTVDEYITKNEEETSFEAHEMYADIQLVVSGTEKISILPIDQTNVLIPYDKEKDIVFLKSQNSHYQIASPGKYFIFLPNDAHRPGIKNEINSPVKKIVVKVKINDVD